MTYFEKTGSTTLAAISEALRSRVPVKGHKIEPEEKRKNILKMEKTSILEKRAVSKGFRMPESTSGAPKTKPDMPEVETDFTVPKTINQTMNNSHKSLLKKASVRNVLKKALTSTTMFAGNVGKGTAKGVGTSGKSIVQHAGGKMLRDYGRAKGYQGDSLEKFVKAAPYSKSKEVQSLVQKREASRVALGLTGAGALYGGSKAKDKIKEVKQRREQRRMEALYKQYYGQ